MTEQRATDGFVHLHLHSEYSLLDGGNRISRLVDHIKSLGMPAVAVTDHGNLFGAIEFYTKAKAAGIKPILGIEAYVAPGDRRERIQTGVQDGGFHLVLLAENETGWRNLLKLSSDAFINGFYYKPRMDKSTLAQHAEGLIAINGHLGSSLAYHLLQFEQNRRESHYADAADEARWHAETFGHNEHGQSRFYLELQRNDVEEQDRINPHLIRLAHDLDLPLVCDNDAHFLTAEDHDTHDTLCCISMQKSKDEADRLIYSKALYVKSPAEMAARFHDIPEAIANSAAIAERCNVELDFSVSHAPVVKIVYSQSSAPEQHPVGSLEWYNAFCAQYRLEPVDAQRESETQQELASRCDDALRALCEAGLSWRYPEGGITPAIRERLDRELSILAEKSISAYFLIVWDCVNWARQRGIPTNARGSGVGTLVGYVLGLSNACPVQYGLLFERFTDPDRSEYPDIDIDICQDGRADVIQYVREKYGHVAQIITFGRLKARAALKDVARVMGLSASEGQRLSNFIPAELNITLDEALQKEPELRNAQKADARVAKVIEHARALESHARHVGIHAAGVVIATQPLDGIVPLCKATGTDDIITQWDGPTCEKVGLLKMDFLGLRTLSIIERARTLVCNTLSDDVIRTAVPPSAFHPLDLDRLQFDDQRVLDVFRRGDTAGIFQFESSGMRAMLMEMKPDRLEDLIAANALYRPGPMELIPQYNARKHGQQPVPRVHEIVDQFTADTYGIMVYQEQVMQIVHALGDIPLREAYSLIKAISKKKESVINKTRPRFIEGARAKGLSIAKANDLFDLILKFAGYGFNKSHSTGYSIIAFQTAYLKTYFPAQYMSALLTFESQARKVESWAPYLEDCRRTRFPDSSDEVIHAGIEVRPPDLNLSGADFTVVFAPDEPHDNCHGHIRFGLSAIKGAGGTAIRSIIVERDAHGPFSSIFDFCERIDLRSVNRATIEALVKCGAMDSLHGKEKRSSLIATIDDAVKAGQVVAADRRSGQATFFDAFADAASTERSEAGKDGDAAATLRSAPPWTELAALMYEKEVLGFHASGHPLDLYARERDAFATHSISEIADAADDAAIALSCLIQQIRPAMSRKGKFAGQKMAWLTLADPTGVVDGVAFAEMYSKHSALLSANQMVLLIGRVDRRRGETMIVVERVFALDAAARSLTARMNLLINGDQLSQGEAMEQLEGLAKLLEHARTLQSGSNHGRAAEILLRIRRGDSIVTVRPGGLRLIPDAPLLRRLDEYLGPKNIKLVGDPALLAQSTQQRAFSSQPASRNNHRNGVGFNGNGTHTSAEPAEVCASIDRY
ncbi:MAG: DNA polymerase III subunit alpha [Phycisphaerales bacterium]